MQTAVAWKDVTAKKLLADCFKTFSGLPEDWTVSGPCHLYSKGLKQWFSIFVAHRPSYKNFQRTTLLC